MKKLFGGIDLTWKKLIIFSIIIAVYTALMALIPITYNTSFRDISIQFEWWILFGVIIICNSKSPLDSALKCFVFFLISQPLIYLIQVPFSDMGWELFKYYGYWFKWTILCLPMGFIGYYIKKKNFISVIILLPMLIFLAFLGLGYFSSAIENFPYHLLSFIACFAFIVLFIIYIIDSNKLRILASIVIVLFLIAYSVFSGGILGSDYEIVMSLDQFDIEYVGNIEITSYSGTKKGNAELIIFDNNHNIRLLCRKKGQYNIEITDEENNVYKFEYHFDEDQKAVVLNRIE